MPTGLTVLIAGLVVAVTLAALSYVRADFDPIDPTREKRWLVRRLSGNPRLAAFVRNRLDRTRAGGLLLTVGFAIVLATATAVGVLLDMVDAEAGIARWDSAVAEYGAANADSGAVDWYGLLTRLGGTPGVMLITVLVGAWGWWRYRNVHVALFVVTVAAGQAALNTGLKWTVGRERPSLERLASWSGSSFPSGHAAAAAAVFTAAALVLTLHGDRKTRALALGTAAFLAVAVAATRAMLGVHWLTDVIAGMAVGFGWFVVSAVAFGGRIMQFGEPKDEVSVAGGPRTRAGDRHVG